MLPVCESQGAAQSETQASPRQILDWDANWLFSKGTFTAAMSPDFDDSGWRKVIVPHDWSTEEPLSPDYSSGNGFAAGGIGWYRKHFRLEAAWQGKSVTVEFDGIYDNSEVWINGQFVGGRPYGYSSFQCDLTPYVKSGGSDNVLAVRVDHSRFSDSRWYTGSGIYRNVRLCVTDKLRIAHWGTYVTTPKVTSDSATVQIETTVRNSTGQNKSFSIQTDVMDANGQVVAGSSERSSVETNATRTVAQELSVKQPQLWSLESPVLYTLRSRLLDGDRVVDETATPFGIRTFKFDPDKGFSLNGQSMKLKGVCIHHDAGALGSAVPVKVLERRLRLLKELGVNAIRTSHNPPAPELLDLCDQLGLLVKDEAFDEFTPTKRKWVAGWNSGQPSRFGYGEFFKDWSVRDIQDMIRRDRNHPCIIMWSIGNEVDYANDPFSHPVLGNEYHPENPPAEDLVICARPLVAAVKALDRTRPVTAALANVAMSDAVRYADLLDIVGYNYQESRYASDHKKYPHRVIFGSENHQDYRAWQAVQTNDYIAGQFLWTGIDYLGEAGRWPNHASGSGLLDLCGFKKPLAWFRQSLWSDKPMVYICASSGGRGWRRRPVESWNWATDSRVTVLCYANCPEVTLTLNGESLGTKQYADARNGVLMWQVPYKPGTLRAVGRSNGVEVCEYELKTAGAASRVELLPDTRQLQADGKDISHIEFRIVDANGVCVPDAEQRVTFEVNGPARVLGIGNADLNDTESCRDDSQPVYHGRGLAVLQSTDVAGDVTVRATAPGIDSGELTLSCRK